MIQNINGVNVFVDDDAPTDEVNTVIETVTVNSAEPATETVTDDGDKKLVIDPKMYVYFDCEFTKLERDAQLLSIGLCDAEGHSFYAEFTDYNMSEITDWVFANVLKKMVNPPTVLTGDHWTMRGTCKEIRQNLLIWLDAVHKHSNCGIQFVSDVCHYDMMLLVDLLWKNARQMPEWIPPCCVDINMDLANLARSYAEEKNASISGPEYAFNPYYDAFNMDRDEYASHTKEVPQGMKHNSMYDAYVIRAIHQSIWSYNVDATPLES